MRRLIVPFALVLLSCPSWATFSGYTYQRVLTIDHTKVDTNTLTLTDFPVLVSTSEVTLSTTSGTGHLANSSGYDTIFSTLSNCSLALFHDTETINNTGTSTTTIWVKVPTVSSATDTTFYLCYGNASISSYPTISSRTWDTNFKAVYHFGNGTTLSAKDSTGNGFNGTIVGGVTAVAGAIKGGAQFNGAGTYITANTISVASGDKTLSVWLNQSSPDGFVFDSETGRFVLGTGDGTASFQRLAWYDGAWKEVSATSSLALDTTYSLAVSLGGVTGTGFINGAKTGTNSYTAMAIGGTTVFGAAETVDGHYFPGWIDEFRISNVARSEGWLKTEYNNQNSPATFLTIGAETISAPEATPTSQMTTRGGKISIQGGKVSIR